MVERAVYVPHDFAVRSHSSFARVPEPVLAIEAAHQASHDLSVGTCVVAWERPGWYGSGRRAPAALVPPGAARPLAAAREAGRHCVRVWALDEDAEVDAEVERLERGRAKSGAGLDSQFGTARHTDGGDYRSSRRVCQGPQHIV
jgi:hypothetical protein